MNINKKKQKSGGLFSSIAALFKGGAAAGGASGAANAVGIFATKAGMLGLLLGGATIAVGAGAVYHLANGGTANKTAYSPDLFQNSYYEDQADQAAAERAKNNDIRAGSVNSTIGMFSASAKQSGYFKNGASGEEASSIDMPEADSDINATDASYEAEAVGSAESSLGSSAAPSSTSDNRLTNKGFGSFGGKGGSGSSASSAPRMKNMGGLSGGIGNKFATMKNLSNGGKTTAMASNKGRKVAATRAGASKGGSKRAYSQAKFTNNMSKKAVASSSFEASRTAAGAAFTGEAGGGDSGDSMDGAGLDSSGMAVGTGLKNGNPSGSSRVTNVPDVSESENASPWEDLVKAAAITTLAATGLYLVGLLFAKLAKTAIAQVRAIYQAILYGIGAVVALAGAALLAMASVLMTKYGQTMHGVLYAMAGAFLIWKGASLLKEAAGMDTTKDGEQRQNMLDDKQKELNRQLGDAETAKNPDQTKIQNLKNQLDPKHSDYFANGYKNSGSLFYSPSASSGATTAANASVGETIVNKVGSGMATTAGQTAFNDLTGASDGTGTGS